MAGFLMLDLGFSILVNAWMDECVHELMAGHYEQGATRKSEYQCVEQQDTSIPDNLIAFSLCIYASLCQKNPC